VEWEFLRFDPRYRALPPDISQAYLHLWATCVHLRRDTFELAEINGSNLPDMVGVQPELFRTMVERCCQSSPQGSLLSKGPRGSVTVDGVRNKHKGLSGWDAKRLRLDCDAIAPLTGTGTETGTGTVTETDQGACSEPPEAATSEPPPSEIVFTFEDDLLVGKGEGPWHVTQQFHESLVDAFPTIVHLAEYRKVAGWLLANPAKRKTRRGMSRFIYGWLERSQNQGKGQSHGQDRKAESVGPRNFTGASDDTEVFKALERSDREASRRHAQGKGLA